MTFFCSGRGDVVNKFICRSLAHFTLKCFQKLSFTKKLENDEEILPKKFLKLCIIII